MKRTSWLLPSVWGCTLLLAAGALAADDKSPSAADALKLMPVQKGVEYDQPGATQAAACTISARKNDGQVGWVVETPEGLVLRRFADTNGDNIVDQWSYYKDGLEVYRDIDSDFNRKADQCRWFHTAGSRWGIDRDEDGQIDSWKAISPEEVTAEVVAALAANDAARFVRLAPTPAELDSLGMGAERRKEIQQRLDGLKTGFQNVAGRQKTVDGSSKWLHFSGSQPGVVPSGIGGSTADLAVYENVAALVQTGDKTSEVIVGTLVRVGDGWRVIGPPQVEGDPAGGDAAGYVFFRPALGDRPKTPGGAADDKIQKLLADLEEIDKQIQQNNPPAKKAELNARRADLLEQVADAAATPEDRAMWIRQLADTVGAAVQTGTYPDGAKRLGDLHAKLAKNEADKNLAAYVRFRQLAAEQVLAFEAAKSDRDYSLIQENWIKSLKQFVEDYPKTPDSDEAMLQLAMTLEFSGEEDEAKTWYGRITKDFPDSPAARKATGAQRRLDSIGKTVSISGKTVTGQQIDLNQYRGKIVLIQYWATWSEPAKTDMAALKELAAKYGARFGVIGVSLDRRIEDVNAFLKENRVPWPQIHEDGGLDSRPANEMGIMTVPTMILIDADGKVVRRSIEVAELDGELKKLIR
ncbi:MAG: redoxin domain-containing protein [Pirellulales bacterium]|nr:redoxin domain-containing protein [Pirellulales bacterium]